MFKAVKDTRATSVSIVNFEQISQIVLVLQLLTLNKLMQTGISIIQVPV